MKVSVFIVVSFLLVTSSALASGTTCSGQGVYYDTKHVDRGIPPGVGDLLETNTLLIDDKVVERYSVLYQQKPAPVYAVTFDNDEFTLETQGVPGRGWKIYRISMNVARRDGAPVTPYQSVLKAHVVCLESWVQVP